MMIKEKYNVNEGVDTHQSLSHRVLFTKIDANKGINILGEIEIAAIFKEYKKLDDGPMPVKSVLAPFNTDGITPLHRKKTLEAVKWIKDKRCG